MSGLCEGLVITQLGKGVAVEVGSETVLCQTLRKLDCVVVGDRVLISRHAGDQGRIERILPRQTVLQRPGHNRQTRPVAANLDTIFVVCATEPTCDFLLIDQYLAICENNTIEANLVLNKIDLPCPEQVELELRHYRQIGYMLYKVSANRNIGIADLRQSFSRGTGMFTGQSGVGKSSLTEILLPGQSLKINSLCATTKRGRHTTTAATLYHLPDGGNLIDSPGVAIFGLAGLTEAQLAWGYREFQPYIGQCRFNDCLHVNDKDCAVRAAVETGAIPLNRYRRFLKLREKMPPINRRQP